VVFLPEDDPELAEKNRHRAEALLQGKPVPIALIRMRPVEKRLTTRVPVQVEVLGRDRRR